MSPDPAKPPTRRPAGRSVALAVIFSLLIPGLGHVYIGRFGRAPLTPYPYCLIVVSYDPIKIFPPLSHPWIIDAGNVGAALKQIISAAEHFTYGSGVDPLVLFDRADPRKVNLGEVIL